LSAWTFRFFFLCFFFFLLFAFPYRDELKRVPLLIVDAAVDSFATCCRYFVRSTNRPFLVHRLSLVTLIKFYHALVMPNVRKKAKTKTLSLKTQSRRIVVLGDAMHAMSPFKGQGANQALSDGPLLVDWLCRKGANLTAALSHFEREMIHRTRNKVIASREAAIYLHSPQVLQTQHDFSGVPKEVVSQFLHELQLRNVTAHLGGQLDKVIYRIIHEMTIAVSPNIMSTRVDDQMETRL
jgi:hypothetical protein